MPGQVPPVTNKDPAGVEREEETSRNSHMFSGRDVKQNHGSAWSCQILSGGQSHRGRAAFDARHRLQSLQGNAPGYRLFKSGSVQEILPSQNPLNDYNHF